MKLLLFDIDGTLLLTDGLGMASLRKVIGQVVGADVALPEVRPDGKTDPLILEELLSSHPTPAGSELHENIFEHYLAQLEVGLRTAPTRVRVLDGVGATLQALCAQTDVLLGVATGNIEGAARLKLEAAGLDGFFAFGGFGSDAPDRTVIIQRAIERAGNRVGTDLLDVVVIGDTPRDIEHGRAAGAATVGVATGSYSVGQLQAAGADLTLDSLEGAAPSLLRVSR